MTAINSFLADQGTHVNTLYDVHEAGTTVVVLSEGLADLIILSYDVGENLGYVYENVTKITSGPHWNN